jgi:membrane protein
MSKLKIKECSEEGKHGLALLTVRARNLTMRVLEYCIDGVWSDTRSTWWINIIKTLNLSVKSFMDTGLQAQACAMTYRTTLALVPCLALIFAIGRGFGLQSVLQDELYTMFPGQGETVAHTMTFVDSYLSQSSEGVFVGVGVVFLLWTLISLLSSIEATFNLVWGIKQGRSFWRKITDYTSMLLILPILMICSSGLSIFLSSTLQQAFDFAFMTPVLKLTFQLASWVFTWLFFAAMFILIPNTKVKITNALIAGVISGTGFRILQWLFVSGQMYVTKYNAIYGSFAFLPLLLIWIQLTWMVVLCGALVCYSSQNIFLYAMSSQVNDISTNYRRKVTVAIATIIVKQFTAQRPALTALEITERTDIPPRLTNDIIDDLTRAGIIVRVVTDEKHETYGYQPALETSKITLGLLYNKLDNSGHSEFIPDFATRFTNAIAKVDAAGEASSKVAETTLLKDLEINLL